MSLVLWFTWNWWKAWVRIEKTSLEISVPVKMTGRELHMIDSSFSQLIIHILNLLTRLPLFHCFSFHCFTVLSKYVHAKSEFTVYSWVSNKEGSWYWAELGFFPKFNKWMGFNKLGVRKFFYNQVFFLYALERSLWKLKIFRRNQVYFSFSNILTYAGYATVISFNILSMMMTAVSVKTLEELK